MNNLKALHRSHREVLSRALVLLLLVQGARGGWLDDLKNIGHEVKNVGEKIGHEVKHVGAQIGPGVMHVGEQIARSSQAKDVAKVVELWINRIKNPVGDDNDLNEEMFERYTNPRDLQEDVVVRIDPPVAGATTCSPLSEPSLDIDCNLEGEQVNCTEPMLRGTVAHMKCKPAYVFLQYAGYNAVTCNDSYAWSEPIIKCVPDCGKRNPGAGQELVAHGTEVTVGEFSWHVGIYRLNSSVLYTQICGATLITPSLVMTAAHCLWDKNSGKILDKAPYKLAAGKYHREWYVDDPEVQKRDVLEFMVFKRFKGHRLNLAYDIAIIRAAEPFVLTWAINVICIDWQLDLEDEHLSRGNNGTIAGWGITELNKPSPVLKWVSLPFVPYIHCGNVVEADFQKYLTQDKLCGGWLNRGISICPGDSGGGYVFPQSTLHGRRYFLHGIASVGHTSRVTGVACHMQQLSFFTKVSVYRDWVEKIVFNKTKKFEMGDD